jgi:hypothetical protein
MFIKEKTTLTIKSLKSPNAELVDISIIGPPSAVLAALNALFEGVNLATGAKMGTEPPPAKSPVRLLDPPYDGEPRTP